MVRYITCDKCGVQCTDQCSVQIGVGMRVAMSPIDLCTKCRFELFQLLLVFLPKKTNQFEHALYLGME